MISQLENIHTDEGEGSGVEAGTVVGERMEGSVPDLLKALLDDFLSNKVVDTEPHHISSGVGRGTLDESSGIGGIFLGLRIGSTNLDLLLCRAPSVGSSLLVDMSGGGEVTRKLDIDYILICGVQALWGAIGTDVSKVVGWFDGVVSGTGSTEVVRGSDCGSFSKMITDV